MALSSSSAGTKFKADVMVRLEKSISLFVLSKNKISIEDSGTDWL